MGDSERFVRDNFGEGDLVGAFPPRFFLLLAHSEAESDPESPIGTPLITRVVGKFTRATRRSSPFNPLLSGGGISFVSACFCEGLAGRNRLRVHQIGFRRGCN